MVNRKIVELISTSCSFENSFSTPYIIAEAGVNHEGSLELAKRLINEAQEGGADAIKFQSYKAETLASRNSPAYWDKSQEPTESQYKLFKKHDSFWKKEFEELKEYCDLIKIDFMSTPFDFESALFLNDLMDVYKISSSDITNRPIIEYICSFNKPIILSTGASFLYEIQQAVEWIENCGNKVALLHCILNYPTSDSHANLGMIVDLKRKFPNNTIGYSDHTLPKDMKVCELAHIMGAEIIEKHFTFDKSLPGNDHYHAMDKTDLIHFISQINNNLKLIGSKKKFSLPEEKQSRLNARRSIVSNSFISKGSIIKPNDLICKRPGLGICPSDFDKVVGKKSLIDIEPDKILEWKHIE